MFYIVRCFFLRILSTTLLLLLCACTSTNYSFRDYYWQLFSIEGDKVVTYDAHSTNKQNPHIVFGNNNKVSGNTGCNVFNAIFSHSEEDTVKFLGLVSTKRRCTKEQQLVEDSLIKWLKQTKHMVVDSTKLSLYNENKDLTLVFYRKIVSN